MARLAEVRHISVPIDRPPTEVYDFCADPHNLPRWAKGLAQSVRFEGDALFAQSPNGELKVQFVARNSLGVLDHLVTTSTGETFDNPMRVLANREGSEVLFSLFRLPDMSDEDFERDVAEITRDLQMLARLLT